MNEIGKLLANMLYIDNFKGYDVGSSALRHSSVESVDEIILIDHYPTESCKEFIHYDVWPVFSDAIFNMAMQSC